MSINFFDLVLIFICLAFALFSYMRGALKELASLIGLGAGYVAATRFHGEMGDMLVPIVRDEDLAYLLSYLMILALGYLVGSFVSGFGDLMRRTPPGLGNSFAGAFVGLLKGLVICMALVWVIDAYITPFQDEMAESSTAPYFERIMDLLAEYNVL